MQRSISQVLRGNTVTEGAGVKLQRVFGYHEAPLLDPFLMLDDFRSDTPKDFVKGFPWHPHRGIETITYITKGDVEHADSLGNSGRISTGDVQWMTAGSGIIHQEMPKGDEKGRMYGFQLWTNLPAARKMMRPRYRSLTADTIPFVKRPDGTGIRVIAGVVDGVKGPVEEIVMDPEFLDVTQAANTIFLHPTRKGHTVLVYVTEGSGEAAGREISKGDLLLFADDGIELMMKSGGSPLCFLIMAGKPIGEPVAWRGPIVMNTREELATAFAEYEAGTFVKEGTARP